MLVRCGSVVRDVVESLLIKCVINGGLIMEMLVNAEVKKISEYIKKDGGVGYQVDLYVDGDRPAIVQAGITENQKKELVPAIDKKAKVKLELTFFDGRPNYKYKGITV